MSDITQKTEILFNMLTKLKNGEVPDNWHNIFGGDLGQSITSNPLKYCFIGGPTYKDANGNSVCADLDEGARAAVEKALRLWEIYTGVKFVETTDPVDANLSFKYSDSYSEPFEFDEETKKYYGVTDGYGPGVGSGIEGKYCVNIQFNASKISGDSSFENINNNRYFRIIVHEIGHALGLVDRYTDNPFYTGMSKIVGEGIGQTGAYPGVVSDEMLPNETPMAWDILAVQYLYGVNTLTNAGNTTYGTSIANYWSGSDPRYLTIWDANGNDTIDLSRRTDGKAFINLSETQNSGGEALIKNGVGKVSFYAGIAFDQSAKYGASAECIIENATGTNLDDIINGNFKDNILKGGGGKDELYGGNGNDTLEGGIGNDKLYGDEYKASFLTLDAFQPGNDKLYGGDGDDYLDGGKGNDELYGDKVKWLRFLRHEYKQ